MCCSPNDLFLEQGDFGGTSPVYPNKIMKGMRFRLFLDNDKQLIDGAQWDYLANGGFQIVIPGFQIAADTLIIAQFY